MKFSQKLEMQLTSLDLDTVLEQITAVETIMNHTESFQDEMNGVYSLLVNVFEDIAYRTFKASTLPDAIMGTAIDIQNGAGWCDVSYALNQFPENTMEQQRLLVRELIIRKCLYKDEVVTDRCELPSDAGPITFLDCYKDRDLRWIVQTMPFFRIVGTDYPVSIKKKNFGDFAHEFGLVEVCTDKCVVFTNYLDTTIVYMDIDEADEQTFQLYFVQKKDQTFTIKDGKLERKQF